VFAKRDSSAGVEMPPRICARHLAALTVSETRNFTWALADETALDTPVAEPDETTAAQTISTPNAEELRCCPRQKKITYALAETPPKSGSGRDPRGDLRPNTTQGSDQFNQPERRLVAASRFLANQEAADQAAARLSEVRRYDL